MNETVELPLTRELFCHRRRRSVAGAREFVRTAVLEWGFAARLDDVLLCVSELATNALLHGVPPGRGYLVRVEPSAGMRGLRVEVHDSGGGLPAVRVPEGEGGRGLLLVEAFADRWGVSGRVPGKTVWCEFDRPPVRVTVGGRPTGRAAIAP
ncbi:ATP-binding protein [uncultured Streptomyces sp.]|uniref:ATP-binding protein n=1 Tax=uncultured Streptomyces sp. TaxID=174707 RepID=UPI0026330FDA|nr:ATP-binding protein [uncultured Streptomyces sp.]